MDHWSTLTQMNMRLFNKRGKNRQKKNKRSKIKNMMMIVAYAVPVVLSFLIAFKLGPSRNMLMLPIDAFCAPYTLYAQARCPSWFGYYGSGKVGRFFARMFFISRGPTAGHRLVGLILSLFVWALLALAAWYIRLKPTATTTVSEEEINLNDSETEQETYVGNETETQFSTKFGFTHSEKDLPMNHQPEFAPYERNSETEYFSSRNEKNRPMGSSYSNL